jgi:hypothetical protein
MPKLVDRNQFFSAVETMFGNIDSITRTDIIRVCEANDINWPAWFVNDAKNRIGRGLYALKSNSASKEKAPATVNVEKSVKMPVDNELSIAAMAVSAVQLNVGTAIDFIPKKSVGYVPFGNFSDVRQIIKSGKFYPMYITGLSGNGKTMMVEQVCAVEKREMVRVNITIETDEDDLIGGFRLIDGRTVWQNGPAIVAMERGAVLLLDEVDLGSNKLMCLQPILEGKPVYLKKINKLITPVAGFTIVATANTKGKGSDDGRFIGTNVMNEAFLERFSITMEQEYPNTKIEQKILNNILAASGIEDAAFTDKLVQWADVIRKSFYDGALSDIISTRRLVHICEAYGIFNKNREKSVTLCLNRFDIDTKNSFLDLYKKLDDTLKAKSAVDAVSKPTADEISF